MRAGAEDVCSLSVVSVNWLSRRAVLLHVTVLLVVAVCLALGWWQLERALSGNTLSWVYTFEWPFFAGYALYMWWKLLHEGDDGHLAESSDSQEPDERASEEDEKLAEYNRYLADLHASDRARRD
jgi:type VI protein secretion system component VasK